MAGSGPRPQPLVGVLALQGGFEAHERMLRRLGADTAEVRVPGDLEGLDALVIPGGESTTMTLGVEREGLADPLRRFAAAGRPVLGSCAGLIMLDRAHLGIMDIEAQRNAFGRQISSFEADLEVEGIEGPPLRGIFIRAPWIAAHGPAVRVIGTVDGRDVAALQDRVLAVAFHAELSEDDRLHRMFLGLLRREQPPGWAGAPASAR